MNKSGIYEIVNLSNGKRYVGSAVRLGARWSAHKRDFRLTRRHNPHFDRAWKKYGEAAFVFRPLLICSKENLLMYEQRAIDALRPEYNASRVAGSRLGVKQSAEAIAKMKGRVFSAEHRAAISAGKKGKPIHTPESRKRMAEFNFSHGIKPPSQKGKPQSAEHRAKRGAAMKGNKNTLGYKPTAETLKKKSLRMMGNTFSRGYKYSDERKRLLYASRRKVNLPDPSVLE